MKLSILTIVMALFLCGASSLYAAPAELVILLDTSRSMHDKLPGPGGLRKLDMAKKVAAQVAEAAEKAGHRVGLYRFRQQDALVKTGVGQRALVTEDTEQCQLMGDMLVGVGAGKAAAIKRWVDGVQGPGEPEVTALGHSPLLGAVRLVLRYIRARRMFAPQTNCVNAWIVVLTDGSDTCTSGGARHQALRELREVSHKEDIRTLVLSFKSKSSAASAIAKLGQEVPGSAKVFAHDQSAALVKAVSQIEGRIAPEACLLSGVAPVRIGRGKPKPPVVKAAPPRAKGCQGCHATNARQAPPIEALLLFSLLGLLRLRRQAPQSPLPRTASPKRPLTAKLVVFVCLALVGFGLGGVGCKQATRPPPTKVVDPPPPVPKLKDPHTRAKAALAQQEKLLKAGEALRKKHLLPQLTPAKVFQQMGPQKTPTLAVAACKGLVHSMSFTPYLGAQQGVAGCLGTRRCNAMDRALVVQACLSHFKVQSTLHRCKRVEFTPAIKRQLMAKAASTTLGASASTKAFSAAVGKQFQAIFQPTATQLKRVDVAAASVARAGEKSLRDNTRAAAAKLSQMTGVDPAKSLALSRRMLARLMASHVTVRTPVGDVDPVLAKGAHCTGRNRIHPVAVKVAFQLQYTLNGKWQHKRTQLFSTEWKLGAERNFKPFQMAIVDASAKKMPVGLPAPATSGCLRVMYRSGGVVSQTKVFPILSADAAACGADVIKLVPGMALARVSLVTSTWIRGRWGWHVERILLDRYGYSKDLQRGLRSGPLYSAKMMRRLLPMHVSLLVGNGMPSEALVTERLFAATWQQREVLRARLAKSMGGQVQAAKSQPPAPLAWRTLGLMREHMQHFVPKGMWVLQPRPWRLATVLRRGFKAQKKGLVIAPQSMFDIIDFPLWVMAPEGKDDAATAKARLEANVALGVLLTEAERLAGFAETRSNRIVNTAAMFRDAKTGTWVRYPGPVSLRSKLPAAVREAATLRRRIGQRLLVTQGAVPFLGGHYIAWWRIDSKSGMSVGEIRYDGTFYGGMAAMKAIATFNECLATQAIMALRGVRLHPDVKCCMKLAAAMWTLDMSAALLGGAMDLSAAAAENVARAQVTRFMAGVRVGERLFRAAYKLNDLYGKAEGAANLYKLINGDDSEAPPCIRLVKRR